MSLHELSYNSLHVRDRHIFVTEVGQLEGYLIVKMYFVRISNENKCKTSKVGLFNLTFQSISQSHVHIQMQTYDIYNSM